MMKKAQKQTSQENGLSASFLDLKSVQKAPQNAITLLASCTVDSQSLRRPTMFPQTSNYVTQRTLPGVGAQAK